MRILHVAAIGHHVEGIGAVLNKLIPEQISLGNEVRIVSDHTNNIFDDLHIITIQQKDSFCELLRYWHPDVVLFHSVYHKIYIKFSKVLKKEGIPYAIQMHGALSNVNYRKNHWKKWLANQLYFASFLKDAKTIVYLNQHEYESCIVKLYNNSASFLPNGCQKHDNISLDSPNPKKIHIVYIGRIERVHKGLDVLIDALNILKEKKSNDFILSFYGNENDVDVNWLKENLINLKPLAEYKGGIYGNDKDIVLRSADIFILTSRSEGMPMGVLEALSYAVPCIVTPGTNMAEIIDNHSAGWVAECTSESIADIIEKAHFSYRKHASLYRGNALSLSSMYDWKKIAIQSMNVFQSIFSKYKRD